MALPLKLQEAHYCCLQSQSNVYGLARVNMPCGVCKILLASLRGKVISLEFQKTRPCSREVHFTYIPADAEIVSLDAFNKVHHGNGAVVGITFIKPAEKAYNYLNIYSEWEQGAEYDLERIAQGCQNLELNFTPYQLYHAELPIAGTVEIVFLLSGSDHSVHLFREDRLLHTFSEQCVDDYFPEFSDLQFIVTCMEIKYLDDHNKRVTAVGCQNGTINLCLTDVKSRKISQRWSIQHDSPITSLQMFTLYTDVECPTFICQVVEGIDEGTESEGIPDLHIVVSSALEATVVYKNILEKGFIEPLILTDSEKFDSVLSTHVADIDFDGQKEILLGTYGQELLVYKYNQTKTGHAGARQVITSGDEDSSISLTANTSTTSNSSTFSNRSSSSLSDGEFNLMWQRSFSDPILVLDDADVTGDGVKEVIVVSLKGLHVLQHNLEEVGKLCIERMKQVTEHTGQEDIFKQLLSEDLAETTSETEELPET